MLSTNLTNLIGVYKQEIDVYLNQLLPKDHFRPEISTFFQMLRDYPSRKSKGLRAILCLLSCETFGGNRRDCLVTASGLELFQNWVLIHDDIEDDSEIRRGQPVLHRKYGIPLAVNVGDALHGKMWETLITNREHLEEHRSLQILSEFSRMVNETTEGQHLDLSWIRDQDWNLNEQDYFLMCSKKTSWYTCISPTRLGAIVAGVENEILEEIIPFGTKLGIAFQIQDDLLNLQGDQQYGKEIGGDIYESKRTLILIELLRRCNRNEKVRLLQILNKPRNKKTPENIGLVLDMMKKKGAIEYANNVARGYWSEAADLFEHIFAIAPDEKAKGHLRELLEYMITRNW